MTRTDDLLEPREAELRDLLERAMTGTPTPTGIGSHALRHGRRLRARRRTGIAAGAVAASAVAALILPATLGGDSATVVDPAGKPSNSATVPVQEPPSGERPDGWWDMPATEMITAVEAILPDGITVTDPGPLAADTPEGGPASGWIAPQLNGATGPGLLNVVLWPDFAAVDVESTEPGEAQATGEPSPSVDYSGPDGRIDCPGNLGKPAQCFEIVDKAGRHVGRRSVTQHKGLLTFEVVLLRSKGAVYAAAFNSVDDKPGPGSVLSAEQPPLTLDQLEDLVRNDTWVMPAS
jgi:hypothetical protein